VKPKDITEAEMALTPRFCPDTQGFKYGDASFNTSPRAKGWVAQMGKGFWHAHHYCWGIISFHRAQRFTLPENHRQALLKDVRGDFWYVVNNTESDFILLPEIYTWIGRTSVLMREPLEAGQAFAKAKNLKPDYWPAYFHWAEFLRGAGKSSEAMEVIKSGLKYSPTAKPLLALYRELGGKPADIPPPIPVASEPEPEQQPASGDGTPATVGTPTIPPKNP
jgi:tetratricopeptide (TPR) repeat protein